MVAEVTNEEVDEGIDERNWWVRALETLKLPVREIRGNMVPPCFAGQDVNVI